MNVPQHTHATDPASGGAPPAPFGFFHGKFLPLVLAAMEEPGTIRALPDGAGRNSKHLPAYHGFPPERAGQAERAAPCEDVSATEACS